MKFEELVKLKQEGKRIPNDVWKTLTKDQKEKLSKFGKQEPDHNDWEWYALSEQIAKDFGSLPYNVLSGRGVELTIGGIREGSLIAETTKQASTVVAMAINYVPSPGVTTQRTDAVNMAAVQLYTKVRHANSGAKVYEAADLMMYILAMKDIYGQYSRCKRALGIIANYPIENRSIPKAILLADGISEEDLRENIAAYRGKLNVISKKINSWAVPKYFKVFMREAFIQSTFFGDSTSIRGQFYVWHRTGYYVYSSTASESGTSLIYYGEARSGALPVTKTLNEYLDQINEQLDALFLDEDVITMSGDIKKAFADEELYTVKETPEDYVVEPVMDENILAQIENSTSFLQGSLNYAAVGSADNLFNIEQSNQLISWHPTYTQPGSGNLPAAATFNTLMFNSHKDDPDYKDNLEWSRCITLSEAFIDTTGQHYAVRSCGLELILDYTIITKNPGSQQFIGTACTSVNTNLNSIVLMMQLDWHPIVYSLGITASGVGAPTIGGDLKKYTTIADTVIINMHNAAINASFYNVQ